MQIENWIASFDEWRLFVESNTTTAFFHTPLWAEVWREYKGLDYACEIFIIEKTYKLLFPYSYCIIGDKKFCWSTYKGYGGFITNDTIPDVYLKNLTEFLSNDTTVSGLEIIRI